MKAIYCIEYVPGSERGYLKKRCHIDLDKIVAITEPTEVMAYPMFEVIIQLRDAPMQFEGYPGPGMYPAFKKAYDDLFAAWVARKHYVEEMGR